MKSVGPYLVERIEDDVFISLIKKKYKSNPFVAPAYGGKYYVCFKTNNNDSEPLYYVGTGFKNMRTVRTPPQEFDSKADAEKWIKKEGIDFIEKWRPSETQYIFGW